MSVDVWLEIDTGGPEPARLTAWDSHPSRVVENLKGAGLDLAELDGKRASAVETVLREAQMRPAIRASVDPRIRGLIYAVIEDCVKHPSATVRVDW